MLTRKKNVKKKREREEGKGRKIDDKRRTKEKGGDLQFVFLYCDLLDEYVEY